MCSRKDARYCNRVIADFTQEIRNRLDEAFKAAQAAEAGARAGVQDQALTMLMDIEQRIYEAATLLNAASLIHLMQRE